VTDLSYCFGLVPFAAKIVAWASLLARLLPLRLKSSPNRARGRPQAARTARETCASANRIGVSASREAITTNPQPESPERNDRARREIAEIHMFQARDAIPAQLAANRYSL